MSFQQALHRNQVALKSIKDQKTTKWRAKRPRARSKKIAHSHKSTARSLRIPGQEIQSLLYRVNKPSRKEDSILGFQPCLDEIPSRLPFKIRVKSLGSREL